MKKINRLLLSLTLVLTFGAAVFPQKVADLKKYRARALTETSLINRQETEALLKKTKFEEKTDFISYDFYYSRAKVVYTGQQRAISQDHQELMRMWSKLKKVDKKITSLYENEFLFKEGAREYWIPVQKKVEESMLREIKANDMIVLFVVQVGGRKAAMANDFEWLFLSTAYEK